MGVKRSHLWPVLLAALGDAQYDVTHAVLDSHTHGLVPQHRKRVYVLAKQQSCQTCLNWQEVWPGPLVKAKLSDVIAWQPRPANSQPTAPFAQRRLLQVQTFLATKGVDISTLHEAVLNLNAITMQMTNGHTPCLTATRAAGGAFWLMSQHRFFELKEMMALQAVSPALLDLSVLPKPVAARMLGQAFTQSVVTRLLARMLAYSGLCEMAQDPYASFLQEGASTPMAR